MGPPVDQLSLDPTQLRTGSSGVKNGSLLVKSPDTNGFGAGHEDNDIMDQFHRVYLIQARDIPESNRTNTETSLEYVIPPGCLIFEPATEITNEIKVRHEIEYRICQSLA